VISTAISRQVRPSGPMRRAALPGRKRLDRSDGVAKQSAMRMEMEADEDLRSNFYGVSSRARCTAAPPHRAERVGSALRRCAGWAHPLRPLCGERDRHNSDV